MSNIDLQRLPEVGDVYVVSGLSRKDPGKRIWVKWRVLAVGTNGLGRWVVEARRNRGGVHIFDKAGWARVCAHTVCIKERVQ